MSTVETLLREGAAALVPAGIERPQSEARALLEAATGLSRAALLGFPERTVAAGDEERFLGWLARRTQREPMAYILGEVEFWSLRFAVRPGVLIARHDSETLIEAAIAVFPGPAQSLRVLDIGVGSGCLLLTLLHHFPQARGVGTDLSATALACTADNALRLGVTERLDLVATHWAAGVAGKFDLIVSNPPYIRSSDIADLQPEVATREPRLALDGGADGLDAYPAILSQLKPLLTPSGMALLELGYGQLPAVKALSEQGGFEVAVRKDLSGVERCLLLRIAG